jgi:hypothetical protein
MNRDSQLLILDAVLAPPNEWDTFKALDLHMLVHLGGRERTGPEWANLLAASGLTTRHVAMTPGLAWIATTRSDG